MKSTSKGLLILLSVAFMGLWGCTQNKSANDAKIREMEERHAKLEEDCQSLTTNTEIIRKRLALVEARRGELAKQVERLQLVVKERDDLRHQVATRTGERDALHTHLVQFSRELQNLAGRVESATNSSPRPVTAAMVN